MKTTPFTDKHIALGAKMHEFAGYNMPIEYPTGINTEHLAVCHSLAVGRAQYNCLPNGKGGIVDDLIVYHYEDNKYMLVVNAANIDKDWAWVNANKIEGVEIENASDNIAQLAIQGPKATEVLQKLTPIKLSDIPYYAFEVGEFAGVKYPIRATPVQAASSYTSTRSTDRRYGTLFSKPVKSSTSNP